MDINGNFSMFGMMQIYQLVSDMPAAKMLYKILSGKDCEEVVCVQVHKRVCEEYSDYSFVLFVRWKNKTYHSMTIRMLEKLENLDKFYEHPGGNWAEFENEQGELCFCVPRTRLLVYFLLSNEQPNGKTVCKVGFPTGEDDMEGYQADMPTMIISTVGEGDGSVLSELARYLRNPDPDDHRFGAIGKVVKRLGSEYISDTGGNREEL